MAGARALWRATGMTEADFEKPIVAIANSFTQFVPGHVHLHDVGQRAKKVIDAHGGWGVEFNTIAVDDGIAMGHGGMLYSLPSRELIADSVEYMVNAHCADALVCISNCDKITPGMLLAAMRLNVPTIFVSGGPMEAGKLVGTHDRDGKPLVRKLDLIDSMIASGDDSVSADELAKIESSACPTCGSCSGMFTANSMNCLNEALGLALPGNGTLLATHAKRWELFEEASKRIVDLAKRYYVDGDASVLPRSVATYEAFENAMTLDIAMGGSTNPVLHILAIAEEARVPFRCFGGDVADAEARGSAAEPSIRDEGACFAETFALEKGGRVKHFLHPRSSPGPFVDDDDHVAGMNAIVEDRFARGFLGVKHAGRSLELPDRCIDASGLHDATVARDVAMKNGEPAFAAVSVGDVANAPRTAVVVHFGEIFIL